jgi:hypothetical protein
MVCERSTVEGLEGQLVSCSLHEGMAAVQAYACIMTSLTGTGMESIS